jgi:FMN phosphatase YigB (HAD superfamily)
MSDRYTIFLDMDGTLVDYDSNNIETQFDPNTKLTLLPGVREKLNEWIKKDYKIIITTGRKESNREVTEKQLRDLSIIYDQLVMGLGGGPRVVINDFKQGEADRAYAVNLVRNKGLGEVKLNSVPTNPNSV